MAPKVTVIMPSLNVAKYIGSCMESVLSQTLQDLEILAIDAGSTDGTLEILEAAAQKDTRVKVIHSDRKSYGYQMNLGISMATGDYVGVVETDDLVEPDMFETLYTLAVNSQADYVKGQAEGFIQHFSKAETHIPMVVFKQAELGPDGKIVIIPKKMPELVLKDYNLWTGLYRRTFLDEIRFNETPGAAYQDIGFLLQTYTKAEKAVYIDKVVYHYRKDNLNASRYDHKAFHYLVEEFAYVDTLLEGKGKDWHRIYLRALYYHMRLYFFTMAALESFWEDAMPDIESLIRRLEDAVENKDLTEDALKDGEWDRLKQLLESPKAFYQSCLEGFQERRKNILYLKENLQTGDAVLFGSGIWGIFAHSLFVYYGVETIKAYCDNAAACQGKILQGLSVLSPKDALCQYPDAKFVVANKKYAKEMETQLLNMGVPKERILHYTAGADTLLFVDSDKERL